jgi:hypothetical protein
LWHWAQAVKGRDPAIWFDFVATLLLGTLTRHNPHLRDRLRTATAP